MQDIEPHVHDALVAELVEPHVADGRAEAAALAAGSAIALIAASTFVPAGPVAVAAGIAAFAPTFRKTREEMDRARLDTPRNVPLQVQEAIDLEMSARVLPGQPEDTRVKAWQAWLPWGRLRAGEHVDVPSELPHPSHAGFEYTRLASRVGQACDWASSLADGSRLHVHEYRDGRCTVHQDKLDPKQGVGTAVIHYMSEAREGQVLFGLLALGVLAGSVALVNRGVL